MALVFVYEQKEYRLFKSQAPRIMNIEHSTLSFELRYIIRGKDETYIYHVILYTSEWVSTPSQPMVE
jgi:hypothetical protein